MMQRMFNRLVEQLTHDVCLDIETEFAAQYVEMEQRLVAILDPKLGAQGTVELLDALSAVFNADREAVRQAAFRAGMAFGMFLQNELPASASFPTISQELSELE